jgi:hypothetical protein
VAPSPKRHRLLWLAAGAGILAILFAQTWTRAHRPGGIDLTTYLEAARAVGHGASPYALSLPFPYIYPPVFAFALIPLAYAPADVALLLWFSASVAAMIWSSRQIVVLAYPELPERTVVSCLSVVFAMMYPVLQSNLRNGQVNLIVLALAVAALRAYRAAATPRAAFWWATAVAIKIVPGVLAPFYVRRGAWRVCALAIVAVAVLCLLPAVTLGAQIVPLTRAYVTSFLGGSFGGAPAAAALDFSVGGMLARIAGTDGPWLRAVGAILPIAVACAADWRAPETPRTCAIAFALYLAVIPLASPKSEVHHLAFVLPAAALVAAAIAFGLEPRRVPLLAALGATVAAYAGAIAVAAWSGPLFFVSLTALAGVLVLLLGYTPRVAARPRALAEGP